VSRLTPLSSLVVAVVVVALATGSNGTPLGSLPAAAGPSAAFTVEDVVLRPDVPGRARSIDGLRRARSTWCGTATSQDLVPNVAAGNFAHWIYALASDAPEHSATVASLMQTDAETIDAWYRAADPTRTARNDLAHFPCGQQIDLSIVRLPYSSAQLAVDETRFELIANGLIDAGFDSNYGKYVVYYDGPANEVRLCGQGGSLSSGLGYAITYIQSCAGVPFVTVAAHEVLHTYGAVAFGAPNGCSFSPAHVCDSEQDIMYPYADLSPLPALILDFNRDDYYAHAGTWTDVQDSPWLVQLDRQVPLALTVTGPGQVVADVPGLECTTTCTTTWNRDTRLVLAATPGPGRIVRWLAGCTGTSPTCTLTVNGTAASVAFAPPAYTLSVSVAGKGTVRSGRPGIACPGKCAAALPSYVPVTLSAKPAKGYRFKSWSGACKGTKPACRVPMSANSKARATFVKA
jgi:hypothetical protein